jgi:glycerophosphoryl diester phosphodiesterase
MSHSNKSLRFLAGMPLAAAALAVVGCTTLESPSLDQQMSAEKSQAHSVTHAKGQSHGPRPPKPVKPVHVELGPRPYYLVEDMDEGPLKKELEACGDGPFEPSQFSIGHRGAGLQFPEHTKESYEAAARMGAGIVECDVTFTQDRELVCRHSQCDLHTTTNILLTPLADKCTAPFVPANAETGAPASATCCTSDLTLEEFRSLCGKMDGFNPAAKTPEEYVLGTPDWRTDLYATCGTLLTHSESIDLIRSLGAKFTPELKTPSVAMPFEGDYTQQEFAAQMVDDYVKKGISAKNVWAQSFLLDDVIYWLKDRPAFGKQAVYLDGRYETAGFDPRDPATWSPSMPELAKLGVNIIAPPTYVLVDLDSRGRIVPSIYTKAAKKAGLDLITWTLERSGPLNTGGGFYYEGINSVINNDGDVFNLLDVLAQKVGVLGVFSDWPATVTYYANCKGL